MVDGDIQLLVGALTAAWNRGDAVTFARSFRSDGTFTERQRRDIRGTRSVRAASPRSIRGPLKGSVTATTVRRSKLIRPDVAVVDVKCATTLPAGQSIQSKLLLVLEKEHGEWTIAAFHNTGVQAAPIVR